VVQKSDASDESTINVLVDGIVAEFGAIDILVNSAVLWMS